ATRCGVVRRGPEEGGPRGPCSGRGGPHGTRMLSLRRPEPGHWLGAEVLSRPWPPGERQLEVRSPAVPEAPGRPRLARRVEDIRRPPHVRPPVHARATPTAKRREADGRTD